MQNQHLISYKDEFSAIAEESIKLCRKYEEKILDKEQAKKFKFVADRIEKNVNDRFRDFTPKIMVYGIYNAGKSTLLNALIAEKKADMGDVPMTKTVQEYRWKEYTIYDTPGIGAPDEKDEIVSKEQLQQCDVILFVTDTEGAFTLGKNYQELIDIIKSGKRLLIVLNNKSGSDFMAAKQVENNIYEQFAKEVYGKVKPTPEEIEEVGKMASVFLVNARNALAARTEYTGKGREKMLEKSNIAELEEAIIKEYGKANGFTILNELAIQLNNGLEELLSLLESSIKDKDGKHSEGSKIRESLRDLQEKLITKVTEHIHDSADDLDNSVYNVMLKVVDERKVDNDEIKEGIQEEVKQWTEQIKDIINNECEKSAPRYKELIGKFNEEIRIKSGDIGSIGLPDDVSSGDSGPESMNIDVSATGDKGMGEIGKKVAMDTTVIGGGITSLLSVAASSSVTWLATFASAVVPYVAPIVGIISLLVHGFSDDDDAELNRRRDEIRAENEAERRRAMQKERLMRELKEKSRRFSRRISTSMISNASDSISNWFALKMEMIDKTIAGNSKEKDAINNDIRTAEQLKAQLGNQMAAYRNFYIA